MDRKTQKLNTIDKILLGCATFIVIFTVMMIVVFCVCGSVPDSLIESVFSLFTGEAIVTFFIWWIKKKSKDKK